MNLNHEELLRLLQRLQWSKMRDDGMRQCPECYEGEKYGHTNSCTLADAIEDWGGNTNKQEKEPSE